MRSAVFRGLLLLMLVCGFQTLRGDITVTVWPQTFGNVGPVFTTIEISGLGNLIAPSLGVFDLDVGFDPSILAFDSFAFDPGNQLNLAGYGSITGITPGAGTVNLFDVSLDSIDDLNNLQKDDFLLGVLFFDALAVGTSPLTLTINALGDAKGDGLSADAINGSITIIPEPASVALLIAVIAACGGIARRRYGH